MTMKPLCAVVFVAGALAFVLSGCVTPQDRKAAAFEQGLETTRTECNQIRDSGETVTYTEHAQCLNGKEAVIYAEAEYPYMDLVERYHADRLKVAELLDNGEFTLDQAKAELTGLEQQLAAEASERARQDRAARQREAAQPGEPGAEGAIEPAGGPAD
jgi:hypothetical protein